MSPSAQNQPVLTSESLGSSPPAGAHLIGSDIAALQRRRLRFLQDFGHSVRTPLDSLLGLTNLTLETELLPQQREYLLLMRESCESLLKTIHATLDFASLKTGSASIATTDFDLKSLLGHTRHVLSQEARAQGVELQVNILSCLPTRVVGDGPRLQELLTHALQALLATQPRGSVLLTVQHTLHDARCFLLELVLELEQSLLPAQVEELEATLSDEFDLTLEAFTPGRMHLSLAQQLARSLRGEILLRAGHEQRMTLFVRVLLDHAGQLEQPWRWAPSLDPSPCLEPDVSPARAAPQSLMPRAPREQPVAAHMKSEEVREARALEDTGPLWTTAHPAPGGTQARIPPLNEAQELDEPWDAQLRVLVVEDNAVNQRLLVRLLEKQGYRVDGVNSGEEALARVQLDRYEVILMDLLLPGMGGMEAARRIQALSPKGQATPYIIALTAHSSESMERECQEQGMHGFLRKPIESARLLALLRMIAGELHQSMDAHRLRLAIDRTVLERDELLVYFHFDMGLLERTAWAFFQSRRERLANLEGWIRQGRWMPALHRTQGLRALLETFCARASVEACRRMEAALIRNVEEDALAACTALERALERLEFSMKALLRDLRRTPLPQTTAAG